MKSQFKGIVAASGLMIFAMALIPSTSAAQDYATIDFSYNGTAAGNSPVTGAGSFSVPTGPNPIIGINNQSSFQFSYTADYSHDVGHETPTFNYGPGNLNSFSLSFASGQPTLSLSTSYVASSNYSNFLGESFSVNGSNGNTIGVIGGRQTTSGVVTLNQQSVFNAVMQNSITTSFTNGGREILINFTPNFSAPITTAAALGGFSGFNWVSQVTASPVTWYDGNGTKLNEPYNDPPKAGYLVPQYDFFGHQIGWQLCCTGRYPFYYSNPISSSLPIDDGTPGGRIVATNTTLTFADAPGDPGLKQYPGLFKYFQTELVGIPIGGGDPVDLANIYWKDNYNGGVFGGGGAYLIAQNDLEFPLAPDSGTGGADILGITYPGLQASVPEPKTWLLLFVGFVLLSCVKRMRIHNFDRLCEPVARLVRHGWQCCVHSWAYE